MAEAREIVGAQREERAEAVVAIAGPCPCETDGPVPYPCGMGELAAFEVVEEGHCALARVSEDDAPRARASRDAAALRGEGRETCCCGCRLEGCAEEAICLDGEVMETHRE